MEARSKQNNDGGNKNKLDSGEAQRKDQPSGQDRHGSSEGTNINNNNNGTNHVGMPRGSTDPHLTMLPASIPPPVQINKTGSGPVDFFPRRPPGSVISFSLPVHQSPASLNASRGLPLDDDREHCRDDRKSHNMTSSYSTMSLS